jgi:glycyl-tRNA synthetase beta subunit
LKVALKAEGMRHDCIVAVIDRTSLAHTINVDELENSPESVAIQEYIGTRSHNIFSLSARVEALHTFLESPKGAALSATFRRVDGIVEMKQQKIIISISILSQNFCWRPQNRLFISKLRILLRLESHCWMSTTI